VVKTQVMLVDSLPVIESNRIGGMGSSGQ